MMNVPPPSSGQDSRERQVMLARDRRGPTALLSEVARLVRTAEMDAHVGLASVLLLLEQDLGLERSAFGIVDGTSRVLYLDCARGVTAEHQARARYVPGDGVLGQVLESGQAAIVPNIREEPRFLDRARARMNVDLDAFAFVCVPVVDDGVVVGTLSGDLPRGRYGAVTTTVEILQLVASLSRPLIRERVQQRESGSRASDGLTLDERSQDVLRSLLVGSSARMRDIHQLIARVAPSQASVLIRGESGTGKELVARAVHALSSRADKPMVVVNCASLPETLAESELFGHVKGAYTGASTTRRGRFELAHGGTLFLDEIGDLSPGMQVKLLRVLQTGDLCRVGDEEVVRVDVRVIAATHVDLARAVQVGRFRQDLYYRLSVFPIDMPPLRERTEDVARLASHFLSRSANAHNKRMQRISEPATELLRRHTWPGNVRELENCISRAVLLAHYGVVRQHHLPAALQPGADTSAPRSLQAMTDAFERDILIDALRRAGGNRAAAAKILCTTSRVLSYRLKRLGV